MDRLATGLSLRLDPITMLKVAAHARSHVPPPTLHVLHRTSLMPVTLTRIRAHALRRLTFKVKLSRAWQRALL